MGYIRNASPLPTRRKSVCLYVSVAIVTFFLLFVLLPLPEQLEDPRNSLVHQVAEATKHHLPVATRPGLKYTPSSLQTTKSKLAYATFLANDDSADRDDGDINADKYFVGTRILTYQLLHAPETKSTQDIPFIVLVNKHVSEAKRERLRQDGAIVWEPEPIDPKWIKTEISTWQFVLGKLRLWELTQFDRICFIDGDTVLTRSLDGIFQDPAVQLQPNLDDFSTIRGDEWKQPPSYVFAGTPEMMPQHHYPPTQAEHDYPNVDYLNAGFFVLHPSLPVLEYYLSLTDTPDRFDPALPEQNLLNYAHRPQGNMPWAQLDWKWNMHYPTVEDLQGGVFSLHEKWWAPVSRDLSPFLESWRWRMEGYHEGRDESLVI
ncbi:glycosyltransferase family 8 [Lecanosticta acicola]|uniref:Glycosyltransferase family 8 n=1 Tax=Lecanosticta acicola TaxID=111012 RepID=A0AAI8YXW0_9PEZI|nr:glycosyltransferase family 8 [Lecanosticta acicola]